MDRPPQSPSVYSETPKSVPQRVLSYVGVREENVGERSCNDQSLEDWVNWFFLEHFWAAGLYALGLCSMVVVWAYCVKQLHDHTDDPAWQEAISGQRLYAGKVQSVELDSILTSEQGDDNPNSSRGVAGIRFGRWCAMRRPYQTRTRITTLERHLA